MARRPPTLNDLVGGRVTAVQDDGMAIVITTVKGEEIVLVPTFGVELLRWKE